MKRSNQDKGNQIKYIKCQIRLNKLKKVWNFLTRPVTIRCKNHFRLCLSNSCSQAKKRRGASLTSLGFSSYGTQFSCFWIIPMGLRRFRNACWVAPNDSVNSSCVWHESSPSNPFNSASSKNFLSSTVMPVPDVQNNRSWRI